MCLSEITCYYIFCPQRHLGYYLVQNQMALKDDWTVMIEI